MKALFDRLRAYHQAFWVFDPWYRRAWYGGPPALAAALLAIFMLPMGSAPSGAPWAKPAEGSTSTGQANPDYKLCMESNPNAVVRGQACDRLIAAGGLSATDLGWAYFGRGWMKDQANDPRGAEADYTAAIKADPKNVVATNNLGTTFLGRGELDQALKLYEEAIKLNPSYAMAIANKAEVLRRRGMLSDAQGEIKKALDAERNNGRAKQIQDLILADIKTMEAAQQAGPDLPLCRDDKGDLKLRGAACDRLIKRGGFPPGIMADAYFGRGWARGNANDPAGAIADYSESIRLKPDAAGAFNNRGALLLGRGDFNDALRDFDEALKISPNYVWAMANKAEVLRQQAKLTEAQAQITRAIEIEANNPRAKTIQGLITADLQKSGGAQKPAEPQRPVTQTTLGPNADVEALRRRGAAHIDKKDFDSAIADFTDVIRREGATWIDFTQRGRAYLGKGELGPAQQDFERAASRGGHGPEPHYNLAIVFERTKNLAMAARHLEDAIVQHGATDPDYFTKLGSIHTAMGSHAKAVETYQQLIKIQDNDKSVKPEARAYAFLLSGQAKKDAVVAERNRCRTQTPPDPNCMSGMRFGPAVLDFQQALIFWPNYAEAFFWQGWIASEIGNVKSAIDEYTKAIKANSNYSAAYNNRGLQYEKAKEPGLALSDYNDAIRIDPRNKFAWANRGILFANTGQRQRAIDDLSKALSIDGTYEYARTNLNRLMGRR